MRAKIKKLIEEYTTTGQLLINELNDLPCGEKDCRCMTPAIIHVIDEDPLTGDQSLFRRCANCGGTRETD
jgi:hypothetical protein